MWPGVLATAFQHGEQPAGVDRGSLPVIAMVNEPWPPAGSAARCNAGRVRVSHMAVSSSPITRIRIRSIVGV